MFSEAADQMVWQAGREVCDKCGEIDCVCGRPEYEYEPEAE